MACLRIIVFLVFFNLSGVENKQEEYAKMTAEAYVYSYPLVLMDVSKEIFEVLYQKNKNQFYHPRGRFEAQLGNLQKLNLDILNSKAYIDVGREPVVLTFPSFKNHFVLLQLTSAWDNIFFSSHSPAEKQIYAITGPDWKGTLPASMTEVKSPTGNVSVELMVETHTRSDESLVHEYQDSVTLVPLSVWNKKTSSYPVKIQQPHIDVRTPAASQVAKMSANMFFSRVAKLIKTNPPPNPELFDSFKKIGVDKDFNMAHLEPIITEGLRLGTLDGENKIPAYSQTKEYEKKINGWRFVLNDKNLDPLSKAAVAYEMLDLPLAQDAIFMTAFEDKQKLPLNGKLRYTLTFPPNKLPPVEGFWSITLYNIRNNLYLNPFNRYRLRSSDKWQLNLDGSLTIYLQHDSPGKEKESNWIPTPLENFYLIMRLYAPQGKIEDWDVPSIESSRSSP